MCLLTFSWKEREDRPLVMVANRDEQHDRPTAPLEFWADAPWICAGRDLEQGGTWLGVDRSGRFAALTNYREIAKNPNTRLRSRGLLINSYLRGEAGPAEAAAELAKSEHEYAGFSLLLGDRDNLCYLSNRGKETPAPVAPGLHALSNHLLDTEWPKVRYAREQLRDRLAGDSEVTPEALIDILRDDTPFPDETLPNTGVGPAYERLLSPLFIKTQRYGTRSTTVVILSTDAVQIMERRYDPYGEVIGQGQLEFPVT